MRITREQYEAILARQAARRNQAGSAVQAPKPEPPFCHEPVAEEAGKGTDPGRFCVRITGFRLRLCDPDNLCPKYFIDCLRYAGIIRDDRPQDITLEVRQERAVSREDERTEILVIPHP